MMEPSQTELMGTISGTDGAIDTLKNTVDLNSTEVVTPPPAAPSTSAPCGKHGKHLHISDANVRRSARVHSKTHGFKSPSCRDKSCLGCSTNPPSLSSSVVRELGSTFCQLEPMPSLMISLMQKVSSQALWDGPNPRRPRNLKGTRMELAHPRPRSSF